MYFNTFSGVYVALLCVCVCVFCQRYIRANALQETKREALTLNRDEITDTQGYSDLPLVSACDVPVT